MGDQQADADALAGDLWLLLLRALPRLGLLPCGCAEIPRDPGSLAAYRGANVYYLDRLSDRERVMAVLHELGHAYLHPPRSGERAGRHVDEAEERLVHDAAARASGALGLDDYAEVMAANKAPARLLSGAGQDQRAVVAEIASFLEATVHDPVHPPSWPRGAGRHRGLAR